MFYQSDFSDFFDLLPCDMNGSSPASDLLVLVLVLVLVLSGAVLVLVLGSALGSSAPNQPAEYRPAACGLRPEHEHEYEYVGELNGGL